MKHEFTIPGCPVPWQRTMHGRGFRKSGKATFSTAQKTRDYQAKVRACAALAKVEPLEGPVALELRIYFPDNRVRDDDNVEKSIRDALQGSVKRRLRPLAFHNDNQVKRCIREVFIDRVNPRVEVAVRLLTCTCERCAPRRAG